MNGSPANTGRKGRSCARDPEFIIGTGGQDQRPFKAATQPNSVVRENHTFGVLALTLGRGTYRWRFVPVPGSTFTDTGSGTCHSTPGTDQSGR